MKTFDEYVKDWLFEYLEEHNDASTINTINKALFEEDADSLNVISECEPLEIYSKLIVNTTEGLQDVPSSMDFLENVFKEYVNKYLDSNWEFANEIVKDIAYYSSESDDPRDFFRDLENGGCESGAVAMFIYNDDCKEFYTKHIDDMEDYFDMLVDEFGELKRKKNIPRYTWMCWLCYEEIAYNIASILFPDTF